MVTSTKRLGWVELLGLALIPVVLLPQLWILGCAFFWPSGGLGVFPSPQPARESGPADSLVWGIWALFATPAAFIQAFVVMPLVALRILLSPTQSRQKIVLVAIALSILSVGSSCVVQAAI